MMPSYIGKSIYNLSNHGRRSNYFDIVGDREKNATAIEGGKLFPIDPCNQYVEVNSCGTVTLAETIDIHMDTSGWAVGAVTVVPLGSYYRAIKSPENL